MTVWIFELILLAMLIAALGYIGHLKIKQMKEISKIQKSKIIDFYKNSQNILRLEESEPSVLDVVVRLKLLSDTLDFSYDKRTLSLAINYLVRTHNVESGKN